jgi:hypothetical protein
MSDVEKTARLYLMGNIYWFHWDVWEKFEDTAGVIRSCRSKKDI